MLTPRLAAAALTLTALLSACGNSAAPVPQGTTSAAASASAAPPAVSPLRADLTTIAAGCTWTDDGVSYCAAVDALTNKACEADLARVFPTVVKKITSSSNDGKGVTEGTDLDRLLALDGQYPLSAAQKKSLVAAVDSLAKRASTDGAKRMIKAIHEHYTK